MHKFIYYCLIIILLGACASHKYRKLQKTLNTTLDKELFSNHFSGMMVYDPKTKDTMYEQNSKKYFTPASNTKIFTLYTALKLLPEKIPVLKYHFAGDTLYMEGTGDPSQLHPYFHDSTALKFLRGYQNISLFPFNFQEDKFGPGWAWEDYDLHYSPERSSMPLYGNVIQLQHSDSLSISPRYFKDSVIQVAYKRNRKIDGNLFFQDPLQKDTVEIPFITHSKLTKRLLEDALGKEISLSNIPIKGSKKILRGMISDSIYKRMMLESDNFLAEQLLILASSTLSDTLNSAKAREHMLENELSELGQHPRWVDGSGLSRYNLFTPESIVHVLNKLYLEIPQERLLQFFAAGGVSGTLENWYAGNPGPYIYAKTGTLGNNHCVSGYLITKSGKILIFSFMNNHFRQPASEVKKSMQAIFEWIRDNY